jgi:Fic family protein
LLNFLNSLVKRGLLMNRLENMHMRVTGRYEITATSGEQVRAFIPHPLPPRAPGLKISTAIERAHNTAEAAVGRLNVSSLMVPNIKWFLYGFVRKEALISSQIEGTQATMQDLMRYEATHSADSLADVEEVCNYVSALEFARAEIRRPKGLPLCTRLLCRVHGQLMRGVRGAEKQPGTIRASQNWIGGSRPGNARFVPPPPHAVTPALTALEKWLHATDEHPPLIRAGLAHVQFETIHPFLDGNGRVGRLLVTLLVEHWGLLSSPLLYLSLALKRHQQEYYDRLSAVRTNGDWEGWTEFFLRCVAESADDGVQAAAKLFAIVDNGRRKLAQHRGATLAGIRLFDALPEHPVITMGTAMKLLRMSKPTAVATIDLLRDAGVLDELTGKKRDRVYAYREYLDVLAKDTELPGTPGEPQHTRSDVLRRDRERTGAPLKSGRRK